MFVLELSQVIDILVNDNPEIIRLAMRGDLVLRKRLGHIALYADLGSGGKSQQEERNNPKETKNSGVKNKTRKPTGKTDLYI